MPQDEALTSIQHRLDEEKYRIERAGSLLKILAEHCQENRHNAPDEAWFEAEYLADRIGEHVEALGEAVADVERFRVRLKYPELEAAKPRLEVVPTEGDAA
jgi:hypothetical protein